MPRQARLNSPGTLHHVIVRGMEKRDIVKDQHDRKKIVARLGELVWERVGHKYITILLAVRSYLFMGPLPPHTALGNQEHKEAL